jgi:uncharacterized integral membrane protein
MQMLKTILLVILFTLLAVLMIQNAQPVRFKFLNWQYDVSQLLLVLIVFVIGWLTGFIVAKTMGRKKQEQDGPPLKTTR